MFVVNPTVGAESDRRSDKMLPGRRAVLTNVRNKIVLCIFVPAGNRCVRQDRTYDENVFFPLIQILICIYLGEISTYLGEICT